MARRKHGRRGKEPAATYDYADADGNVLTLRGELSAPTIRKLGRPDRRPGASAEDVYRRRSEMLFERLVVSWEIAGLPLEDQKLLLGRYRMADTDTERWVRQTIAEHIERHIPELVQ